MGEFAGIELTDAGADAARGSPLRPWRAADADAVFEAMQRQRDSPTVPAAARTRTPADGAADSSPRRAGRRSAAAGEPGVRVRPVERAAAGSSRCGCLRRPAHPGRHRLRDVPAGAQGHGYAAEGARALTDWGFGHGLERIQIFCDVRNLASARTAFAPGSASRASARDAGHTHDGAPTARSFARVAGRARGGRSPRRSPLCQPAGLTDGTVSPAGSAPAGRRRRSPSRTDRPGQPWRRVHRRMPPTPDEHPAAGRAEPVWTGWSGRVPRFRIVDVASGRFAGSIADPPGRAAPGRPVSAMACTRRFRGRGYTARALRLLADWALRPGRLRIASSSAPRSTTRVAARRRVAAASSPTGSASAGCATPTAPSPTRCGSRSSTPIARRPGG